MMGHWIIAPVVLPAVLAGLGIVVARHQLRLQRALGLIGTLALLAISLLLMNATQSQLPAVYRLGNWPAPFGIVLVLDRLSAVMLVLLGVLALAVQIHVIATGWDKRGGHFHALFLFQLMGIAGAFLTGDVFNLFVFFEVLLIASYGLMIHGGGKERLVAGVQYIGFNLIGSSLFLIALAVIYSVTGTLNMADLAQKVPALPAADFALIRAAAVLLFAVFAIKGALVPLQFWLPGTYAFAPGPVAALFAVMTKVGAYAVVRLGTLVFPPQTPAIGDMLVDGLYWAALATVIVGAVGTLGARHLQRMVAFAGIGSMGAVFLGVSAFTPAGTTAALYYMIHSTLATALLFLLADLIATQRGTDAIWPTGAIPKATHGLAALFMIAAIAMAGMPPLSGFLAKVMVLDALRDQAATVWTVILVASLLGVIGFARAGSALFWSTAEGSTEAARPVPPLTYAACALLLGAMVALTVYAGPVTDWLAQTAQDLHDPSAYRAAHNLPAEGM